MLEALVASILNRVLGNYVSNLNYDQLKIAIWNGEVNLKNLKLRKDALDKLRLPIDVVEGYLGELTLSIPWSNLKAKPVKVDIRNVYLLAAPKTDATVNLKDEEERAQQLKQQKLETAELLETSKKETNTNANESNSSGGFVGQLTTKVIDNFQITLKNIHLRYEDNVSCPDHPFAAGITLKELSAISTNENWEAAFIGDLANTIHKLAKLESLSVYWNTDSSSLAGLPHEKASQTYADLIPTADHALKEHQYIVKPVSGTGKIKLNKSFGKEKAKVDTTLLFDELAFGLDDEQYRDALLLIDLFHSNLKKQEYLKFHPPHGTTPISDPKAYLHFAGQAVLSKIHERNYRWTWDHFKKRRDQRLAYIDCYSAHKRGNATTQQNKSLAELEWDLSFEDIRFYRSIAKSRLRKEKIRIEEAKQKNANKGWFSSWWGGTTETPSNDDGSVDNDSDSMVLTEQQKKELYDAIDYDEDKAAIESAVDMPKDTMKFVLSTKLNRGSFRLLQHPHTTKHQLTSIVFDTVGIEVIQYTDSMKISTSLGDLQLYDGSTKDTLYPQLIGVKNESGKGTLSLLASDHSCHHHTDDHHDEQTAAQQPFLSITYQRKPLDKKADQAIKVVMRHLEIIYNPITIQGVISFFKSPNANSESFDALIEVAGDTLEGFKQQTRAGLEYALENHSTLDLDVDMDAPIIIIPENCLEEDSPVMIIDAGHIRVDSDLANQELAEEFKANTEKDFGLEDYKRLEGLMYDKFNVEFTQIKLLIGRHVRKCIAQLEMDGPNALEGGNDAHVLHRIDMNLLVERCILPGASQFTKIKVKGELPLVSVNFSTQKYKTLMKIIDLVLPPSDDGATDETMDENQQSDVSDSQQKRQQQQHPQKNLFAQQFWGVEEQHDLLLSDDGSIHSDYQNNKANNSGAKSNLSDSSSSSSASKTEIARAQQNQLKFDFSIGHVSALIYQSANDSTSMDTLLCELILEQFGLEFINRMYDMYVHVRLQALNVLDKMEHGKEYRYLVTSNDVMTTSHSQKDLVDVKYQRVNPKHPQFEEKFDGYEQTVDMLLSTLTFVVTRHSVLTLYNWIMTTFTGDDQQQQQQKQQQTDRLGVDGSTDDRSSLQSLLSKGKQQAEQKHAQQSKPESSSMAAETPQDTGSIKVNVEMVGVQLILNKDGMRLGTGILSYGNVKVLLLPSRMMVMGKFGNFILTDDSSSSSKANTNNLDIDDDAYYLQKISERSDVKMISIDDDELLDFTYSTLDPQSEDFPGYHQHLYMRLGAFRLLYVDALKPILDFLSEFLEMKNVYDSARTAATTITAPANSKPHQQYSAMVLEQQRQQQQQQGEQEESLFCFDVVMQSPIVIFPVGARKNNNVVIANLGEIRASNEFVTSIRPNLSSGETTGIRVNQIRCGLYNISLYSQIYGETKENGLPMLDNVDISVKIESAMPQNQGTVVGPQTSIRGRISNVLMYLSEDQYSWLLEIENRLMTTFMGQPENDANGNTKEPMVESDTSQQQERRSFISEPNQERFTTENKNSKATDIQLDLCFDMELMCLEIYNGSEKDITRREQHALCRLSFDDTSMKLQMAMDGPMLIEVQMRSINFYDIRKDSTSQFKDILPAGKQLGGPQLQLQYKTGMKTDDGKDMTNISVTLDRPQVVMSLDYLMLLKDFFATPFMAPPPPTEAQAFVVSQRVKDNDQRGLIQGQGENGAWDTSSHISASASRPYSNYSQAGSHQTTGSVNNQEANSQSILYYKINVVDLEIICLAHPDSPSSEAMVISFEELLVVQQATFALRLNGIGAMLCRMDKRNESLMPLVEPFNVGVDMQTLTSAPGYTNTNIDARVQPITLRLSYHDFVLVMDIINKATALLGNDSFNRNDDGSTSESIDEDDYDEELDNELSEALTPASLLSSPGYSLVRNQYDDPQVSSGGQQKPGFSQQQQQSNRLIEPYIVMSRESMNALFEGFQLIVVEDLHDLPFMDLIVKPFAVSVSDWSRALTANVKISSRFNYFNFKNSYWEPLIEPYNFEINVTQEPTTKSLDIGLSSKETLNINLTHTFLETVLAISSTLSDIQPLPENAQKRMKPFVIQNRTGYDLRFWNMSSDVEDGDTSVCFMKNGQDQDWTFRDWQKRKDSVQVNNNLLGIEILHMGWESIQHIPLDVEGKQSYRLKNGKDGIEHRVVVEIMLKNHVKTVIFHGGLTLDNQSEESMQITMVDLSRRIVSPVWKLEPNELLYVPIGLSYRPWIVVRPSEFYHWSSTLLHWSDMIHPKPPSVISCKLLDTDSPEFIYHLRGTYDTKNSAFRQYPIMKIQFGAPIKIVNHLPFDFKWTMMDQNTNQCISTVIKSGASEQLHTFSSESDLAFVMDIQRDDYEPTELTTIQVSDSASQEGIPILVKDKAGNPIYLRLVLRRAKNGKTGLRIKAYVPYLILNKSAHSISIRCRNTHYGYKAVTSVHDIPAYEHQVTPYMFSYPKADPKNRSEISIDGSKWSQALSFEAVGSSVDVRLASQNNTEIHAGIHVEEGTGMYHLTKLVTISPRFVLKNDTHFNLKFAEYESNEASTITPSETLPLYMTRKSRSFKWLCLQLADLENQWSTPFDIQEIGTTFIKVPKNDEYRPILIKASVMMKDATIFVTMKHTTDWPYMIINCSSADVTFYQEPGDNDEHSKNKKSHMPTTKYHLTPEQKYMKYSWDKPATKERRLILEVGGKKRVIDFQAIGAQIPFRYKKHYHGPGGGILSIDIAARDSSLVLLLTDFREENSLFRPTSSGESTIAPSSSRESSSVRDHFETVDIELVVNYTFKLQLNGIGVSVVNSKSQEIVYATIKDLDVKYTDSNLYQSIRAGVQWLQIDNQLFGTTYPILFYPSTLPKTAPPGANVHPTFHLALDKVKDNTHGVTYFKLFSVLFQEMTIEVDEDLLYALIEFAQFDTKPDEFDTQSSPGLLNAKVEAPPEDYNQALLYFEEFCIQPMRLNLSFVRTLRVNTVEANENTNSPIGYIFDVFTMTIGNINDAPVKLNALIVENLRASSQDLSSRIMLHYQDQVIYQVHKVVGSADLIGNPVGLFNNLSSGFGELFYEPYQGFITSDRPQDLGIGIARGVGGFMKKSVFGFTDSFSRVTGSLGKGLAVATLDKKFQDRRRIKLTRNKPQHAIFGVTQGVSYFGTSLASGFAGLVKRPIEGAEESGVGGFFGGVGKGLVGVVTKPVVGLFDLASNVSAGIRETTNLFEAGALVRERLPRYIGKDGTLGIYSQREALGQMWMKEMKDGHYSQEKYIAHTLADNDEKTAILTYQRLFMVHTRKLEVEWCERLEEVESCKWIPGKDDDRVIDDNGNSTRDNSNIFTDDNDDANTSGMLMIYTKTRPVRIKTIYFMESTSGPWFTEQIQKTMDQLHEEKNRQ